MVGSSLLHCCIVAVQCGSERVGAMMQRCTPRGSTNCNLWRAIESKSVGSVLTLIPAKGLAYAADPQCTPHAPREEIPHAEREAYTSPCYWAKRVKNSLCALQSPPLAIFAADIALGGVRRGAE